MNIFKSAACLARRLTQHRLVKQEAGLVTVEWVAIAAAVVVGGIVIAYEVLNGMDPAAKNISTTIINAAPGTTPTHATLGDGA